MDQSSLLRLILTVGGGGSLAVRAYTSHRDDPGLILDCISIRVPQVEFVPKRCLELAGFLRDFTFASPLQSQCCSIHLTCSSLASKTLENNNRPNIST